MYALVDGNDFYCSAERSLRPALRRVPLCILSNNDGCVIARSQEAKQLGVKMGQPYFEVRHLELSEGLLALSANFALYGDISERLMSLAAGLGPAQMVYSVDECFIGDLAGVPDLTRRAWAIRDRILRGIGIPCGIGIGATMTLAKLANHVSKSAERKPGSYPAEYQRVCNLTELSGDALSQVLARTPCEEIWGIGRKLTMQLAESGILTAKDLRDMNPALARKKWSINLEKTVRELGGEACIPFEEVPPPRQTICVSRSFGQALSDYEPLAQAVSHFASRAAEKLRRQGSYACQIQVFAASSPFRNTPRFSRAVTIPLIEPSADTQVLVGAAVGGLQRIYEPGYMLSKAGVLLLDLCTSQSFQQGLDLGDLYKDRTTLQATMDSLNRKFGRGTVQVGAAGAPGDAGAWKMKQERRTPLYTTRLSDVPQVSA